MRSMPSFYDSVNDCQLKQAALLWRDNRRSSCLRAVRRVYSRPASNIARSDRIGWPSEATRYADERSLGFAVLFRAVAALRAGARGISGVNEVDRHTTQLSFVGDKRPKLRECPRVECCALQPSSLHPRANVPEIFQRNRPLRAFGLRNNPFGQTVVDVFGKAALLTGQLPQAATATECAELLQLVPEPPVAVAHVLDRLPRFKRTLERIGLRWRGKQLQLYRQPHNMRGYHTLNVCSSGAKRQCVSPSRAAARFLRVPEGSGFQRAFFL
jgi:hypothetical protein